MAKIIINNIDPTNIDLDTIRKIVKAIDAKAADVKINGNLIASDDMEDALYDNFYDRTDHEEAILEITPVDPVELGYLS